MPVVGGPSDKLGNSYEALWAIDQLLRIVEGDVHNLTLEPLDKEESRGIEFTVRYFDGASYYWSVKRQTTQAAGWTLRLLTTSDDKGRSILGVLFAHAQRNVANQSIFASTLGAYQLNELNEHSSSSKILDARLSQNAELKADFDKYVLPLSGEDVQKARELLLRTRAVVADQRQLRDRVHLDIRKIFYSNNNSPLDPAAVRGHLSDLLLDNIHRPIDRNTILTFLANHGIALRDWALDKNVRDRLAAINKAYTEPLKAEMINATFLPISGGEAILGSDGMPVSHRTLLVSGAGGGKSTTLANLLARLHSAGIPVLVIRFDQLAEGILNTTELGHKLLLPESPVSVLAAISAGRSSALIMDQLDAVSIASGRRAELWSRFDELCREAERYARMSLIVGCREFDLEHDYRMRKMTTGPSAFSVVKLSPLSSQQVDAVLNNRGINPSVIQDSIKPILTTPLHLSMFLQLPPVARKGVGNRDQLFDSFWAEAERRTTQRLGRPVAWTRVMDLLCNWLSANQQLSAPRHVLDDVSSDAAAMASEHVLVVADNRYRFFHETFFDYAFARRFAARGEKLLELLLANEQYLFRRAQVRQVLTFFRSQEPQQYLDQLEVVLTNPGVRFHIKKSIFQWLSSLQDPQPEEWHLLERLPISSPDLRSHVMRVVWAQPAWFSILDGARFFENALSSENPTREQEVITMIASHPIMEAHSVKIADLLRRCRKQNENWNSYLRHICRFGEVYHSREMFELFLSLIDDGTLDGLRPGFAVNDNWWTGLYSMAEKKPDLTSEAIGHWFDRLIAQWRSNEQNHGSLGGGPPPERILRQSLDRSGNGAHIIYKAIESPHQYARELLPRVARFVTETAKESESSLPTDPLFSFRTFGDNQYQVPGALLSGLARALEALAKTAPAALDDLISPYQNSSYDTIAYLLLRAWTAAPETYADKIADYLAQDSRRLKVGYTMWDGSGGSAENYVSVNAVRMSSQYCSPHQLAALETVILGMSDKWEAQSPKRRGLKQLELLRSFTKSRLSANGVAKLQELERKFPDLKDEPPEPEPLHASPVGPPIPENAQEKMTNDQWLRAMQKYAGQEHSYKGQDMTGGEYELAFALENRTKADPVRFATLADLMPDNLAASYFDAIVRGVSGSKDVDQKMALSMIALEQISSLIKRVHALPNRPCGRSIMMLIQHWVQQNWPDHVLEAVCWYVMNDPDPKEEAWKITSANNRKYYRGDPYTAGINSTRGEAAGALMRLLFDQPRRFPELRHAINSVAHDPSVAVRSVAVNALYAMLKVDVPQAIIWFKDCIAADPILLSAPMVEKFVQFSGYKNFTVISPVLANMLNSIIPEVIEAGSRQLCVLALSIEEAAKAAERARNGSVTMRKAAATVYATNIAHKEFGAACRNYIRPFFSDPDDSVRGEAASAFNHIADLSTTEQGELLNAFLEAKHSKESLEPVVRALEDSPVQLPELVCQFVESCLEVYREEAGDISKADSMIAMELSKIVVRLYAQTDNKAVQSRCLNIIDEMERFNFFGLADELSKLDR